MIRKLYILFILCFGIYDLSAQSENQKHDLGINMAGLLVKKEETVAPALFYKYKMEKYQYRLQVMYDLRFININRNSTFTNGSIFFNSDFDSSIEIDPAKNLKYGIQTGLQKNLSLNSKFCYFYGLDLIFMRSINQQKAEGKILNGNINNRTESNFKYSHTITLNSFGIGIPLGITYQLDKRFFISAEAKLMLIAALSESNYFSEIIYVSDTPITNRNNHTVKHKGLNVGLIPLTGLTAGILF